MENPDLHNDIDEAVIFAQIAEIVAQLKEISCNRSANIFELTYWQNFTSFKSQLFCYNKIFCSAVQGRLLRGHDIGLGSVTGCCLWSLGNLRQHTELQYVG